MSSLARNRITSICWWVKAENEPLRDLAGAPVWEILRRTEAYKTFGGQAKKIAHQIRGFKSNLQKYAVGVGPLRELIYAKKPPEMPWQKWLPLGTHDPIQNWEQLAMRGCWPELDWAELHDVQRHTVQRFPVLPRQEHAESHSPMHIFVCELERDPSNPNQERVARCEWTASVEEKPLPDSDFRVLPKGIDRETYVVVSFELGQPEEALERQFRDELDFKLYPGKKNGQPCKLMDLADGVAKWQSDVPPDRLVYPALWQESIDPNARAHTRERVVIIPNRQSPFVLCWIPARYNREQMRSRFNNAVRSQNRSALEKMCNAYWALPEAVPGTFGGPPQVLPPWPKYEGIHSIIKRKPAKWKEPKDFWLGLTAHEFREAGIRFNKSPAGRWAGAFFQANGLRTDAYEIEIACSGVKKRIREIDAVYGELF